ncbi:glycine oxidase ThiO [Micromonospora sonneratiae]|uniref:glycine oxidase n=1 Tax=Micromonospora sonneratiae TaxID=1184706 RepID=A0ABW3YHW2_9ACTN
MLGRAPFTAESDREPFRADVAVVGGGPIGLAVAWRCAVRGRRVAVYDPDPGVGGADGVAGGALASGGGADEVAGAVFAAGRGAYQVAAGMLAPVAEAYFGEEALTRLLTESARRWPAFAAELSEVSGLDLGYRTEGTLVVGLTSDDVAEARRLWSYQQDLGLPITPLRPAQLRAYEPLLAPGVRGGAHAPGDHQIDPRRLVAALRVAADRAGVAFIRDTVTDLSAVDAPTVVVAAGCGAAALTGLPVRPVKGQILRLRAPGGAAPGFRHVVRGYVDGWTVYLVPRTDGEVVVGATVEERVDDAVTAGAVLRLLRAAADLMPEIAEYELVEAQVGMRPGTPDNAPIIGRLPDRPEVIVATGHYRHGILLTPVTADLVADLLSTGVPDPAMVPFTPDRFVTD